MARLHVASQKQEDQTSISSMNVPPLNNLSSDNAQSLRRRQRQISSGSTCTASATSSRSASKRKKRLARQLSRRLSDMFAKASSSSMGESSTHHHASADGRHHQQRRSLIAKAARRDSLADVYDRISRGEAKYVPGVDHLSLLAQISTLDDDDGDYMYDGDGSSLFGDDADESEEDKVYEVETKNVKTSRAA